MIPTTSSHHRLPSAATLLIAGVCLTLWQPRPSFAQGPLAPPSAPSPGMKTLTQIEPRIAIPTTRETPESGRFYTINNPGSYYLTANIQVTSGNGIHINASNVTLDLNGFALICEEGEAGGAAVYVLSTHRNIKITNGHITGGTVRNLDPDHASESWLATFTLKGWMNGIYSNSDVNIDNINIKGCRGHGVVTFTHSNMENVSSCGNGHNGISAFRGGRFNNIETSNNSAIGFMAGYSILTNIIAKGNKEGGIHFSYGSISHADADKNGGNGVIVNWGSCLNVTSSYNQYIGIQADSSSVTNATAYNNGTHGISASEGTLANCQASENGGDGLLVSYGSVTNSTAAKNHDNGISITGGTVSGCRASNNGHRGIYAAGGVAAHCVASGNGTVLTGLKQIDTTGGQRDMCVPPTE